MFFELTYTYILSNVYRYSFLTYISIHSTQTYQFSLYVLIQYKRIRVLFLMYTQIYSTQTFNILVIYVHENLLYTVDFQRIQYTLQRIQCTFQRKQSIILFSTYFIMLYTYKCICRLRYVPYGVFSTLCSLRCVLYVVFSTPFGGSLRYVVYVVVLYVVFSTLFFFQITQRTQRREQTLFSTLCSLRYCSLRRFFLVLYVDVYVISNNVYTPKFQRSQQKKKEQTTYRIR